MSGKNFLVYASLFCAVLTFSSDCLAKVHKCPPGNALYVEVPNWSASKIDNTLHLDQLNFALTTAYLHADEQGITKFRCAYSSADNKVHYSRAITVDKACHFVNPDYIHGACSGKDCDINCPD